MVKRFLVRNDNGRIEYRTGDKEKMLDKVNRITSHGSSARVWDFKSKEGGYTTVRAQRKKVSRNPFGSFGGGFGGW